MRQNLDHQNSDHQKSVRWFFFKNPTKRVLFESSNANNGSIIDRSSTDILYFPYSSILLLIGISLRLCINMSDLKPSGITSFGNFLFIQEIYASTYSSESRKLDAEISFQTESRPNRDWLSLLWTAFLSLYLNETKLMIDPRKAPITMEIIGIKTHPQQII